VFGSLVPESSQQGLTHHPGSSAKSVSSHGERVDRSSVVSNRAAAMRATQHGCSVAHRAAIVVTLQVTPSCLRTGISVHMLRGG
jgi:hypothetical protein